MASTSHKQRVKRVAELRAIVDALKLEESELQARQRIAHGNYFQAQREMNRHEPLTPTMKAALQTLVEYGATVTESQMFGRKYWIEMPAGSEMENQTIRSSVFYGLLSREAIENRQYISGLRYKYTVSEHGVALAQVKK